MKCGASQYSPLEENHIELQLYKVRCCGHCSLSSNHSGVPSTGSDGKQIHNQLLILST